MPDSPKLQREVRARMPDVIAELRAKVAARAPDIPPREAFRITNANAIDGDTAVVRIYEEVWQFGANAYDVAAELDQITAPKIRVEINSPGGDVWDGISIYNALRAHPAEVTTRVDGMAASIASVIAQAGDRRTMLGGSQMMIHNASGLTIGDANAHAEMVEILRQQDRVIAGIYAERSGSSAEDFAALMDAETWMTAAEAVERGLADEVVEPRKESPQDRSPTLAQQISSLALQAGEALSDVERLVANHGDAGDAMTEAKRQALVALADAGVRASALLPTPVPSDTGDVDRLAAEYARYVALTTGAMQ